MPAYCSPDNPNIIVIPPKKKTQAEIKEKLQQELELSNLHSELMGLYKEIPNYKTRLEELERIQALIANEANMLREELNRAKARKCELEELFKG